MTPVLPSLPKRLKADAAPQPLQLAQAHGLELRPSLSSEQMAALALATVGMYQPATAAAHKQAVVPTTSEDWKKAGHKEQRHINQANYRKRKRQYDQRLMGGIQGEIQSLEHEISRLETRRSSQGRSDPVQAIGDFNFALGVEGGQQQQRLDMRAAHGRRPAGAAVPHGPAARGIRLDRVPQAALVVVPRAVLGLPVLDGVQRA